jgi:hypothetical protein
VSNYYSNYYANAGEPSEPGDSGAVPDAPPPAPSERVALGLLASLLAVVAGVVLTVVIWRAGYIASITSFVIAIGAVYLYTAAAGAPPRKGLVPVILVVALGVVASFFAVVVSDLLDAYDNLGLEVQGFDKQDFVLDNVFNGDLLAEYGKDMAMFAVFAVLGVFSTLRRLWAGRQPA